MSIGAENQIVTTMSMKHGQVVSTTSDGQRVSQIIDGQRQPQASQIPDGQVQAPSTVSQISDGQPQAPVQTSSDGQPKVTKSQQPVCVSDLLTLTLENGMLKDQADQAGGNNQFQFDNPVQAGGYGRFDFSLCENGTVGFRGSTDWWKCDSGAGFYNLYNAEISPDACKPCKFASESLRVRTAGESWRSIKP